MKPKIDTGAALLASLALASGNFGDGSAGHDLIAQRRARPMAARTACPDAGVSAPSAGPPIAPLVARKGFLDHGRLTICPDSTSGAPAAVSGPASSTLIESVWIAIRAIWDPIMARRSPLGSGARSRTNCSI